MSTYSTVTTDIATPPRVPVSSTVDETDLDGLDRGAPMVEDSSVLSPSHSLVGLRGRSTFKL